MNSTATNTERRLPTGTVTFLFTDIEGSTKLWEKYPEEMKFALAKHDAFLKEAVESNNGQIIKTTGDGTLDDRSERNTSVPLDNALGDDLADVFTLL